MAAYDVRPQASDFPAVVRCECEAEASTKCASSPPAGWLKRNLG